ncbi:COP9 signalosome complex subunit 1-like [Impatiens glandulifera]|uniref:COP9 signalosome complex subunit 1-like n=1 Tax=Impatiens glandulifera TaxID=253017 RepID=UPI001FB17E72|nr:COP9 signalosome complex subunit 1-like [Impatiens glandulifera]
MTEMNGEDEVDEIYGNVDEEPQRSRPIFTGEQLDIEAYASLYSGRTKIVRLIFIANHCNNAAMEIEALKMAHDEIKTGEDTKLYRDVVQKIDGRLGPDYALDSDWADTIDKKAELRQKKLETDLSGYRLNLIKESIRMGYNDFGDFYYAHGKLEDAFKNYIRARDYCTTSKHHLHMCTSAILVSIEMSQFIHVPSYVGKAEQIMVAEGFDYITASKMHVASALALLEAKKYKHAARKFLETGLELENNYTEVIVSRDVATYGGLCALATFDRTELKTKVLDNSTFQILLELVPEVRELIHNFYYSRYASALDYLANLKTNMLLDIHLHDHVDTLYEKIRHKALIQYTHPFVSVDLHMMASAFRTTVEGLQKELEALITNNQIQARIDSHNKVLYARHADQRNATFHGVLQTGREFDRDVKAMLLRSNFLKQNELNIADRRRM